MKGAHSNSQPSSIYWHDTHHKETISQSGSSVSQGVKAFSKNSGRENSATTFQPFFACFDTSAIVNTKFFSPPHFSLKAVTRQANSGANDSTNGCSLAAVCFDPPRPRVAARTAFACLLSLLAKSAIVKALEPFADGLGGLGGCCVGASSC